MTIIARIRRIEAAIQPAHGAIVLHEPAPDSTAEACAAFDHELSSALESGATVIVRRNGTNRLRRPGVTYVDNDLDALLHRLAATPSSTHKNALAELIASIQGTALPVVREVSQ